MKNSQKGFVIPLVIVVIALLAIGGGIYAYQKNTTQRVQIGDTNATSTIDTVNWKTYKNTELGFQFMYPSTWNLEDYDLVTTAITLSKEPNSAGFFAIGGSYVIIYPNGKPGSGVPSFNFEQDSSIVLNEQIDPATVVRLKNGDIATMNITFKNPPQKNSEGEIEIYAGIKVNNLKYVCISDTTGKEISDDKCFSGAKESGFEYGTNQILGSLDEEEKTEVYKVLKSFSFLR